MKSNVQKPSVTVGIPAYNEEANILHILAGITKQVEKSYHLKDIIVSSDGSTDRTAALVKGCSDSRIRLLTSKNRMGLAENQNTIFGQSNTDIVVLVNADTILKDRYFVEMLITPIINKTAEITSCPLIAIPPTTKFEKILYVSMLYKNSIFEEYNNGTNLYTCHGPARAFSKKVYSVMRFPESIGEDAFSYLYCQQNGYAYKYVKNTEIFYKLPDNFADHENQSLRLFQSKNKFMNVFSEAQIKESYALPVGLSIKWFTIYLSKYPLEMVAYLFVFALLAIKSRLIKSTTSNWDMSASSKVLIRKH